MNDNVELAYQELIRVREKRCRDLEGLLYRLEGFLKDKHPEVLWEFRMIDNNMWG